MKDSFLYVVMICILFMAIGPTLIIVNQYILKSLNFPYPMFLAGLGVLVSGIVATMAVKLGYVQVQRAESIEGVLWYKRVLPVGLAHACTLAFGNLVYLYLDVGFIQMLKAFTPVFIMVVSYLSVVDTPTHPVILSVLVISLGTAMTCSFTPSLSIVGLLVMALAESSEAVRLVFTQFFLQKLKFGILEGMYVLCPASAFWLFLACLYFEVPTMLEKGAFSIILNYPFHFLAASIMGLGVQFVSYYVIQITSSLTMKILSAFRNVALVFVGILFYNETVTFNEAGGYALSMVGFAGYNMAKMGYFDPTKLHVSEKVVVDVEAQKQ
ncbi:hypothetical protein EON65_44260 [archaeon]|nr:MAG: hypothetical protein EON65_44260 [archaeon]